MSRIKKGSLLLFVQLAPDPPSKHAPPLARDLLFEHEAMENTPGDIEGDQDDDEPEEEGLVVLAGEKAQRDNPKDTSPNEK